MRVATTDQLLDLLDSIFDDGSDLTTRAVDDHWAEIFRRPGHPLNTDLPDACLVDWTRRGLLPPGAGRSALDIGCGLGRNARWLTRQGYRTTGIDISPYAIKVARERSSADSTEFVEADVLREKVPGGPYDLVVDSGCFHHLPPHRRISYVAALRSCLAPGGWFSITTFAVGKMGSEADDLNLIRQGRLEGGIAYSEEDLRQVFSFLTPVDSGPMPAADDLAEPAFSADFLTVALFRSPTPG